MESSVVPEQPPSTFVWAFILSILFVGILYGVNNIIDIQTIKKDWPKYRCSPSVLPFTTLYGYDITENFNYCIQNAFQSQMGQFTNPFAKILTTLLATSMTFLQNLNSLRVMFSTLLGGITKMLQELTDRVRLIMTQIRVTSLRMQALMKRMFAVFYAIIYMGLSGIQAGRNFGNTIIFKFLDTFCFDGDTKIFVKDRGLVPISSIQLGEVLGNGAKVKSTYKFQADGQPMVLFPPTEAYPHSIYVSSNHYMFFNGEWIRADQHPSAQSAPDWSGGQQRFLYCLDTETHEIPVGDYRFLDYDETDESDAQTMKWVEKCLNNSETDNKYGWSYQPCCDPSTLVRMNDGSLKLMSDIQIGDTLSTGYVTGIVKRRVNESVKSPLGITTTPSTLLWKDKWVRAGHVNEHIEIGEKDMIHLVVMHSSMVETSGEMIRDFVEVHSPEAEFATSKILSNKRLG